MYAAHIIVTGSYLGRILGNREFFLLAGTRGGGFDTISIYTVGCRFPYR